MAPLRLAVIGVGHLGQHHARILAGLPDVQLVGVADANFDQAQKVARQYGTQPYPTSLPLVNLVDAAVLAVPTILHHEVARPFLERGLPLLIEKPLAATLSQADDLVKLAERRHALLQVGHIERFNPAFEELQRHGLEPLCIDCLRTSSFTGRSTDIGAVLDMMIHDLDLVLSLVRAPIRSVEAMGISLLGGHEDMANARITFANGCVANLTASRIHPQQVRTMNLWSAEGLALVDFASRKLSLARRSEAIRRQGLPVQRLPAAARATLKDDLFRLHLPLTETDCNQGDQLTRELEDFIHCVRQGQRPRVTGEDARQALAVADCILESIRLNRGQSPALLQPPAAA